LLLFVALAGAAALAARRARHLATPRGERERLVSGDERSAQTGTEFKGGRMNRRTTVAWFGGLALAGLGVSVAGAHEGHEHKVMGTIERLAKERLEVKDAKGKTVGLVLNDKTVCLRGEKPTTASGLLVGERVVVEFREAKGVQTAVKVRVGEAAAQYSCPMHPEVVSDRAGKCPKCGMNLTRKEAEK
jgi:hypothetical protein